MHLWILLEFHHAIVWPPRFGLVQYTQDAEQLLRTIPKLGELSSTAGTAKQDWFARVSSWLATIQVFLPD